MRPTEAPLESELAGLDALDRPIAAHPGLARRTWRGLWPKLAAIGIAILAWQLVVWSGWKPDYVLPGPWAVFGTLAREVNEAGLQDAIPITLRRALIGFALAVIIGILLASPWSASRRCGRPSARSSRASRPCPRSPGSRSPSCSSS